MPTRFAVGFRSGRYGTKTMRTLTTRLIPSISRGYDRTFNDRADSDRAVLLISDAVFWKGSERNRTKPLNLEERRRISLVQNGPSKTRSRPSRLTVEDGAGKRG